MSESGIVRVHKAVFDEMMRHLEASYPNEGAGFLLGANGEAATRVEAALPVENRWDSDTQTTRYLLDARDWMRAEEDADARALSVVGIFHSHPDHPPLPSQFDLNMALPNLAYLITSVREGKAEETRAWRLEHERTGFAPEELETA